MSEPGGATARRRGRSARVLLPAAAAAAALIAAAVLVLGGDDPCRDDGRAECVAQRFASGGPEKCELVAPELLAELTGRTGAAALDVCRRNVSRLGPRGEVRVLEREPAGGAVRVEVLRDGREGVMTLERRGGRWWIVSFAE